MTVNATERREQKTQTRLLAVSRDEAWLGFVRNTLRRTDQVEVHQSLENLKPEIPADVSLIVLVSSELVPARISDFQKFVEACAGSQIWVLAEPHDLHQRVNDKHLHDLGVSTAERPENAKALRRLLKMIFT